VGSSTCIENSPSAQVRNSGRSSAGRPSSSADDDGQREGERVDEVELRRGAIEELVGHGANAGFESGDGVRGERGADQVAQGAVLRRIDLGQHPSPDRRGRGDEPGGIGGERGGIAGDGHDVVVTEDVPGPVAVLPDRMVVAHRA